MKQSLVMLDEVYLHVQSGPQVHESPQEQEHPFILE